MTKKRSRTVPPAEMRPTAEEVRALFDLDAERGLLIWRVARNSAAQPGVIAGSINKRLRRRYIGINGVPHPAYRLIWLWVRGAWPAGVIDHINGDSLDDRPSNLRDVDARTNSENARKAKRRKRGGSLLGAHRARYGWRAVIRVAGKTLYLGHFQAEQEAHERYLEAKRELHAGCTI